MDESTARSRHPNFMRQAFLSALLPTFALFLIAPVIGDAQVATNITSLPTDTGYLGTTITHTGGHLYDIGGGTRPGDGTGPILFHSFRDFSVGQSVGQSDIANFFNDSGLTTTNIIGRVTGGNPSNIDGIIRTTDFPGANLFLINPFGIVFGPHGSVNVGGSVSFSTAQYLRLFDGINSANFYADSAKDSLTNSVLVLPPLVDFGFLSPVAPAAYGFLDAPNPLATITVQGSALSVLPGQSISLIGGKVIIESGTPDGGTAQPTQLSALNGRIQLATAASPGEFDVNTLQSLPNNPVDPASAVSFTSYGSVSLATGSSINVSGASTVFVKGGQLVLSVNNAVLSTSQTPGLSETISLSSGSSIVTSNSGTDPGADIQLIASKVQMDGDGASILSATMGDVPGGNVTIQGRTGAGSAADSVTLSNGAAITTQTFAPGDGGDILITSGDVELDTGASINSFTFDVFGSGVGGDISLNVGTLTLGVTDFASIQSLSGTSSPGLGQGGNVTIQGLPGAEFGAAESVHLSVGSSLSSQTFGSGDGGGVAITSKFLTMEGGASISATASADGRGGDIVVKVQQAKLLGGATIASATEFFAPDAAAGGTVTVQGLGVAGSKAASLTLAQGSGIISRASGEGRLGDVVVRAKTVTLTDGAAIKVGDQNDPGTAGNVTIDADSVGISDGSAISSQAFAAPAGQVIIMANNALTLDNGSIVTQTHGLGRGGDVVLNVGSVSLANGATINSSSSSTEANAGDAGNVTIQGLAYPTNSVTITDSSVTTSTEGPGQGGAITMEAVTINLSNGRISASTSSSGDAGGITATVGTLTLTNAAEISSSSSGGATGAAGSVTIQGLASPANSVTLTNSSLRTSADSTGRGGSIAVDATNLTLNGATISASVQDVNAADGTDGPTSGLGNIALTSSTMNMTGGTVTAATSGARNAGTITLTTTGNMLNVGGGGSITSSTTSSGDAGQVIITAPTLSLNDATITTSTSSTGNAGGITATVGTMNLTNGSNVSSNSTGTLSGAGDAGSVTIEASGSFTSNGSKVSTSAENATGGDILIDAQNVQLSNGTLISANSNAPFSETGEGNAGNITITSASNVVMQNSSVTTEASDASGGNIKVDAPDAVMVQLVNSRVSTSVGGDANVSNGGNITIDPQFVVLQNSQIRANAVAGAGGAIDIIATSAFIADPLSIVNASSTLGISGTVNIQSPLQNIGGELTALTQEFSSAAALLAQQCAARAAGGTFSTFVVSAREGLPMEPGGFLASPSLTPELLGPRLSLRDPQSQFSAVTGLFQKYDAKPIQLAKLGSACHQ